MVAHDFLSRPDCQHIGIKILGIAHAVDTRHRRHDNDIATSRQQRRRRREAKFVDLIVDHQIFLDILVDSGYISLGLIIVVIRHKILHRILGKKILELAVKLCGECLVMAQDERRTVDTLDNIGHSESFA